MLGVGLPAKLDRPDLDMVSATEAFLALVPPRSQYATVQQHSDYIAPLGDPQKYARHKALKRGLRPHPADLVRSIAPSAPVRWGVRASLADAKETEVH